MKAASGRRRQLSPAGASSRSERGRFTPRTGGKLLAIGSGFEAVRQDLLERYRCTACRGTRIELVAGVMMGPYYRFCRGCDGRGYRVHDDNQERLQWESEKSKA